MVPPPAKELVHQPDEPNAEVVELLETSLNTTIATIVGILQDVDMARVYQIRAIDSLRRGMYRFACRYVEMPIAEDFTSGDIKETSTYSVRVTVAHLQTIMNVMPAVCQDRAGVDYLMAVLAQFLNVFSNTG